MLRHVHAAVDIGKASARGVDRGSGVNSSVARARVTQNEATSISTKAGPGTFIILTQFGKDRVR